MNGDEKLRAIAIICVCTLTAVLVIAGMLVGALT